MSAALSLASTYLARASAEPNNSAEQRRLEAAAQDALRGAYRPHWNLPGVREALAQGGRLMLRGANDIGELLLGPSRSPAPLPRGNSSSEGSGEGGGASGSKTGGSSGGSSGSAITGADRRKLCALVEGVYRETSALCGTRRSAKAARRSSGAAQFRTRATIVAPVEVKMTLGEEEEATENGITICSVAWGCS